VVRLKTTNQIKRKKTPELSFKTQIKKPFKQKGFFLRYDYFKLLISLHPLLSSITCCAASLQAVDAVFEVLPDIPFVGTQL
jgi:hypothetical protein